MISNLAVFWFLILLALPTQVGLNSQAGFALVPPPNSSKGLNLNRALLKVHFRKHSKMLSFINIAPHGHQCRSRTSHSVQRYNGKLAHRSALTIRRKDSGTSNQKTLVSSSAAVSFVCAKTSKTKKSPIKNEERKEKRMNPLSESVIRQIKANKRSEM